MPFDIKVSKEDMTISVFKNNKMVKYEDVTNDTYVEYMRELGKDNLDVLRKCNKLFKPRSFLFKGVEV